MKNYGDLMKAGKQLVEIGAHTRINPTTGETEQVEAHTREQSKADTKVDYEKVTPVRQTPGVKKDIAAPAGLPRIDTDFRALEGTKSKVAGIAKANSERLVAWQLDISEGFVESDHRSPVIAVYVSKLAEDPSLLSNYYNKVKDWEHTLNTQFKLPSGKSIGAGKYTIRDTRGRFNLIKTEVASHANLDLLRSMQKSENNVYIHEQINKRLTEGILNSENTSGTTRAALRTVKHYTASNEAYSYGAAIQESRESAKAVLETTGQKKVNDAAAKLWKDSSTSSGATLLKAAVSKFVFNKEYVPTSKEAREGFDKGVAEGFDYTNPNEKLDTYANTMSALAREHYDRKGVKTLTLYKAVNLEKNHPVLKTINKGEAYDHEEESVSSWFHSPELAGSNTGKPKKNQQQAIVSSEVPVHNFLTTYQENPSMNEGREGEFLIMTDSSRKAQLYVQK